MSDVDLGDFRPNPTTCPGFCERPGKFRVARSGATWVVLSTMESLFLVCVAVLVMADQSGSESTPYGVLSILLTTAFWYFSMNAVFAENRFQLYAALATSLAFTAFVGFKCIHTEGFGERWERNSKAVLAIKLAFQLVYLVLAWPVRQSFGYRAYKVVGANVSLQRMYNAYLCFLSLVKMDFVCGLTLVVMAFYFFEQQLGEGVLLVAALVVTLVWALMGWQAVIRETRWTMHVYFALALCEPAFIVYKLLRLFAMEHSMLKPHVTKGQFAVVGGAALLLRILLLVVAVRCYQNFGRGLYATVFAPALDRNHERPASLLRASQHKRGSRGAPPVGVQSLV